MDLLLLQNKNDSHEHLVGQKFTEMLFVHNLIEQPGVESLGPLPVS